MTDKDNLKSVPEMDKIAKLATERVKQDFIKYKMSSHPPIISYGIVRAVLEAAEQVKVVDHHLTEAMEEKGNN